MKSHVMSSKFIINKFRISDIDGMVYVLDLNRKKITKKGPKKIGVIKGHFDEETEKKLSDKYERPMGIIFKRIIDSVNNIEDIELTSDEIEHILKFAILLFVRNP